MTSARVALAGVVAAALSAAAVEHPSASAPPRRQSVTSQLPATLLGSATPIERLLSQGDEHRYSLALVAGECVNVVIVQNDITVAVQTRAPDGGETAEYRGEVTGQGPIVVDLVADTPGLYTIAIKVARGVVRDGTYRIRLAGRHAATDSDRALQSSRVLRTSADHLEAQARYDDARVLYERALALAERVGGPDDPDVLAVVISLAENAAEARDNDRARALFERARGALVRLKGPEHPATAIVDSRLALIWQRAGQRAKADALLQPAMDVIEAKLGSENLDFVRALVTLGIIRDAGGDPARAEEINARALGIVERLGETDTLLYANLLNNQGNVAWERNDLARAEDLLSRSLAIGIQRTGSDSFYVSTTYQNLGIVARERKDYAAAEAYDLRAIAIRERLEGKDHPDVAQVLINLANVYRALGDTTRCLDTQFRALEIFQKSGGQYDRGTMLTLGNIARTYAGMGDARNAVAFERRAEDAVEVQLALNLAVGSEREKLAFARSVSERTERTISLHLNQAPSDADAGALAMLVLLQRKGRVLDAMSDTLSVVRHQAAESKDRTLLDQLDATTASLAGLVVTPPAKSPPEIRQAAIRDLESRKERLESELSTQSALFRAQRQPVSIDAVQAAMPDDAALLEFAVYRPFNPTAERNAEAYGPPHYAAYVLRRTGAAHGIDLGPAAQIDAAAAAFRRVLRDPSRTDLADRARAIDDLVTRPLRPLIGSATRLLISPDGDLNLVPFEAFIDEQGRYLIERYATSYLTSGRDLLRMQVKRVSRGRPVVISDPLFGEPSGPKAGAPPRPSDGAAFGSLYFAPLAGTAMEARTIKTLFPDAVVLAGPHATKAMLKQVDAPLMLHIASHGFFLDANLENPLLRSGLALAGANLTRDATHDGILTALEASSLDLWGTKLVTLSACDTGLGEVRNGEGVYGLRRAFVLAGAETLVMSLWPVSDRVTRETMTAYYTALRQGAGRGDALRLAKLAMLKQHGREHPFYWASFIQSGEWATLDGKR
jgi:CHAT domain-containing protein